MARSPSVTDEAAILDRHRFTQEVRRGVSAPDLSYDPDKAALVERLTSSLTPRQMEVLQMKADGLRYVDIASLLGITPGRARDIYLRAVVRIVGKLPPHLEYRSAAPESLVAARELAAAHGLHDTIGGARTAPRERLRACSVLLRDNRFGWRTIAGVLGSSNYLPERLYAEHRTIELDKRVGKRKSNVDRYGRIGKRLAEKSNS